MSSEQGLSRMLGVSLAERSDGQSETSTTFKDSKEKEGCPGSSVLKDLIPLGPEESAMEVVLKKIRELSDSVRGEEGGEGKVMEWGVERVGLSPYLGGDKISLSVCVL